MEPAFWVKFRLGERLIPWWQFLTSFIWFVQSILMDCDYDNNYTD